MKEEVKDELEGGLTTRRSLLSKGGRLAAMAAMAPLLDGMFDASPASASSTMSKLHAAAGGGTLIEGNQADPTTFNPLVGQDFAAYIVAATCFNGLLTIDKDGHAQPAIASLPKVTNNSNTYTFKLRRDVKWSDGTPLTAHDAVFTFELMFSPKYKDFASAYSADAKTNIKSAKAIDAHTFQLTTKQPYAPLLLELCTLGLLPKHVLGKMSGAQLNTAAYNLNPTVVNGPFKLVKWNKGSQITFAANPHYWRGKPKLSRYIIKIIADPTSIVQQLQTGAIQVGPVTSDQFQALSANPNIHLVKFPSINVEVASFQLRPNVPVSKFFKDPRVRQALWWALDRKAIIKSVWFGTGALFTNSPEPPGTSAYISDIRPNYQHNPAMAKKLLDAAGWKVGPGGVRQKGGMKAAFTIMTTTIPQYVTTIEAMAQQWKAVGVQVATKPVPISTIIDQLAHTRTFDMIMIANNLLSADPDLSAYYASRNSIPGGLNGGGYKNPKMDEILDKQIRELNETKRLKLLAEFQQIFAQDPPGIPVLSLVGAYGVRTDVHNENFNTYNEYTPRPWLSSVTVGK